MRWADLPAANGQQDFKVTNPCGSVHHVNLSKHALQVLLGVMMQPIYSPSLARLCEYVRVLRVDHDIEIHTERYDSNGYGVFFLVSKIEKANGGCILMTRTIQISRLMQAHGLTFKQASLIAGLHFGDCAS